MTKKLVTKAALAAAVLGAVTLARPAPADAHFSLSIGLPGFAVYAPAPCPPHVVYEAPATYYYPGYYYEPAPRFVVVHGHHFGHRFEGRRHHHHHHHDD
jgi:hypothetical protein